MCQFLRDVAVCSGCSGLLSKFPAQRADHDYLYLRIKHLDLACRLDAIHAWQYDVHGHHIREFDLAGLIRPAGSINTRFGFLGVEKMARTLRLRQDNG